MSPRAATKRPKIAPRRPQDDLEQVFFSHRFLSSILVGLGSDFGSLWAPFWEPKSIIFGIDFLIIFSCRSKIAPRAAKSGPRAPKSLPRAFTWGNGHCVYMGEGAFTWGNPAFTWGNPGKKQRTYKSQSRKQKKTEATNTANIKEQSKTNRAKQTQSRAEQSKARAKQSKAEQSTAKAKPKQSRAE